jgi:beta-N-acetylhexosaminidase
MNYAELVGQILMPSIDMDESADRAAELITRYHLGGVIVKGNIEDTAAAGSAAQVRQLTAALRAAAREDGQSLPPLVAIDQEYGWVTRIRSGILQLPSAMAFGAAGRPDLTRAAWQAAGEELAQVGINVDFAPAADVVDSAGNTTIGSRSFGADPQAVGRQVAAAVAGLRSAGVAATIKHFPGHGHTDVNSHAALPVLRQSLAELHTNDLPPFQAGIDAGAELVMTGHLELAALDPGRPATFSAAAITGLLRGQLGFRGVVITDSLTMVPAMRWPAGEAAVRAFLAGNDILLMPADLGAARQGLLDAVASGRIPRRRLLDAVARIETLKQRLAPPGPRLALSGPRLAPPGPRLALSGPRLASSGPAALPTPAHQAAAQAVAAAAVTVLRGPCDAPLVTGPVRVTASAGRDRHSAWLAEALAGLGLPVVTSGGTQVHLVGAFDTGTDLAPDAAVTVAMDTPFLLLETGSPTCVATYSSTQASMRALAAVLAGTARAPGRSPVPLPGLRTDGCGAH